MASLSYVGKVSNNLGGSTGQAAFLAAAIGTAAGDRRVIIIASGTENASGASTPTLTIGGVSAHLDAQAQGAVSTANHRMQLAIFSLDVASGTTADIVVQWSQLMFDTQIFVWAAYGLTAGVTTTNSATGNVGTPSSSANVNVSAGDFVIAGWASYTHTVAANTGFIWTGVTRDDSIGLYSNVNWWDVGSATAVVGASPRTVSMAPQADSGSGDNSYTLAVAVYTPVAPVVSDSRSRTLSLPLGIRL